MNLDLLNSLKQKRKEIADREGREVFYIFGNSVLEDTVKVMPKSLEDLENIKGWGKKKIEKYGLEVLGILNGDKQIKKDEGFAEINFEHKPTIYSVEELIYFINSHFSKLGSLQVRAEVTEVNRHPNGYCFFTIKDPKTQDHTISCYIARAHFALYDHLLEIGMEVLINATPSVYKNGRLSLVVHKVEAFGEGALKKAFEALKNKLAAKGYFDQARKRPIPGLIQKIGLITSESGAAINDFRKNLGHYGFKISLLDVRVEGDLAESTIISAINWFNKNRPELDVLVLIRGGGSLENLKSFNSELLAEAIVTSRIPIITGIGHEKDVSISDLAADLTLSTPTATAAYIRNQRERLLDGIAGAAEVLNSSMEELLEDEKRSFVEKQEDLISAYNKILQTYKYWLISSAAKIENGQSKIFRKFKELEQNFIDLFHRHDRHIQTETFQIKSFTAELTGYLADKYRASSEKLSLAEATIIQGNPEAILKKGYSIIYKDNGKVLKSSKDAQKGELVNIKLSSGKLITKVEQTEN